MKPIDRRTLLARTAAAALASTVPLGGRATDDPRPRLVVGILRGGLDGLATVVPHAEPRYASLRGALAIAPGELLRLDGLFGLHPRLGELHARFQARELLIAHAVATPYRDRSHFDAQKVLESGLDTADGAASGWVNRVLAALPGTEAIALGTGVPQLVRGPIPVTSWAPSLLPGADEDMVERLRNLYAHDERLRRRFEQAQAMVVPDSSFTPPARLPAGDRQRLGQYAAAAARFLRRAAGPTIAVLDIPGWDTHANQGAGQGALGLRLAGLDAAIASLRSGLGATWSRTVVLLASEFGRTAAANGTGGTDHGTAGVALLVGGAVRGGRIVSDWPGLAARALRDGRDLEPTLDLRALIQGVLREHLGADDAALAAVFPGAAGVRPVEGVCA